MNNEELRKKLIDTFVKARKTKGITQAELSEKSGVEQYYISLFENNKGNPSLNKLINIAKSLNCEIILVHKF